MAKSPRTPGEGLYKLHSTEWSVNFIGFALMGVALFGLVAALQQVLGANLGTTATNAVKLLVMPILTRPFSGRQRQADLRPSRPR